MGDASERNRMNRTDSSLSDELMNDRLTPLVRGTLWSRLLRDALLQRELKQPARKGRPADDWLVLPAPRPARRFA